MVTRTTLSKECGSWNGEFQGSEIQSDVSIIFNSLERAGIGPALHKHPYSETFIVLTGVVTFTDGDSEFEATAGEIVVVPGGTPHCFTSKSDHSELIDIHASATFITEWLTNSIADYLPSNC